MFCTGKFRKIRVQFIHGKARTPREAGVSEVVAGVFGSYMDMVGPTRGKVRLGPPAKTYNVLRPRNSGEKRFEFPRTTVKIKESQTFLRKKQKKTELNQCDVDNF